ncbi:MAG: NAD(P)H-binding protein [Chloroflexota bacterium]
MYLVTGSNGFVGRSVVRALDQLGLPNVGLRGRLNNIESIAEQLEGIDTVIHLASGVRYGRQRNLNITDIDGTRNLIEAGLLAGINHIVYISHIGADSNSLFPVMRAKGTAEEMLMRSEIPTTIIRSATLYGRNDRFLTPITSLAFWNWPFVWLPGGGRSVLQPLWVEDLVRIILEVSDTLDLKGYRGRIYTAAGEERFHYEELVRLVLETANLSRQLQPINMTWVRLATRALFGWRRNPPITLFFLDRLNQPEIADLDVVYNQFGFHPARMFNQISYLRRPGLARYVFGSLTSR